MKPIAMPNPRFPMSPTRPAAIGALLLALCVALPACIATATASEVRGEYSRTPPAPAPTWRSAGFPATAAARMHYGEMATSRLLELQRARATPGRKALQVGIGRSARAESAQPSLPALQWRPVAGGTVARIEIRSMDAMALRVGLDVQALDDRVELRFGGSSRPADVVVRTTGAEVKRLPGPDGLFWTPVTDGDTQIIELFRPRGVPAFAVRLDAPMLSHLVVDTRNRFKLIEKIGESQSCNVDTTCRLNELGPHFVNAKNAVAHMSFVRTGGGTFNCTGTLLADSVPVTQVPYFFSANHCFSSNTNLTPNASQMQSVANTLNTIWNYETTGCGNLTSTPTTVIGGGAAYLYSSNQTDAMLLRLNNAPPAFAYFQGWNAAALANGTAVTAIHHPNGDSKKVSGGQVISSDAVNTEVGWLTGTTEEGSSGSGIFTLNAAGEYVLRGGLYGGFASCSNSGSLANTQNRDYYSRLNVDFPSIRSYLEPQPTPLNGNRPRIRARAAANAEPAPAAGAKSGRPAPARATQGRK